MSIERASKKSAARHEAGHAVAAVACGYVVALVELMLCADGWEGRTCFCPPPDEEVVDPVTECIVAWGGAVAEGTSPQIRDSDSSVFRDRGLSQRSIELLRAHTETLLHRYEGTVDVLAAVLEFMADIMEICTDTDPELRNAAPNMARAPELGWFLKRFWQSNGSGARALPKETRSSEVSS